MKPEAVEWVTKADADLDTAKREVLDLSRQTTMLFVFTHSNALRSI